MKRSFRRAATLLALGVGFAIATDLPAKSIKLQQTLDFAINMAKKGNWREARYRWRQAESIAPEDPHVLNNLGVASEILGEIESARLYYEKAANASRRDAVISENLARFREYLRLLNDDEESATADGLDAAPFSRKKKKVTGDTIRVVARFKLPPRMDLEGYENLLVASFLTEDNDLLDTNRELTRHLRGEFSKRGRLDVLDVTPAPAIPEQTVEDLLANIEFWKHLGREHDADLIVSGVVSYNSRETSGFQDVDVVSPVTGQKVRETRFVEQEQFTYTMEVFFIDGATGELKFRDRLQRGASYPGTSNDALSAFYGLVESITKDVLAVVSPRVREDVRLVYRD
jgi:hypothetical protein